MTGFPINPPNAPIGSANGIPVALEGAWYKFFLNIQKVIGGPADPFDSVSLLSDGYSGALAARIEGKADATTQVIAGAGLTGGGTLEADRTFNVGAGTGITVNADDVAIDLTAEAERIRDTMGTALVAGTGITVTPDDGADTITIASTVTGLTDGDKGDITVSASGATWTVDNGVLDVDNFAASAIVTEAEGLASSDNDTSIPTTAAVKDYVDDEIAGVGGSGTDFFDQFKDWRGARGNAGAIVDLGITLTQTGSGTTPTFATTSTLQSKMRRNVSTGASSGAFAGLRDANHIMLPRAGFRVRWSFGLTTINASDRRLFAGVTSDSLLNTNEEPNLFDHCLGFAAGAAQTNWFRVENDSGSGTATETDTGIAVATDVLYVVDITYPAGGAPTLSLKSYATTDVTPTATYSATLSTDYPTGAQALLAYLWATNNATANTVVLAFASLDILS